MKSGLMRIPLTTPWTWKSALQSLCDKGNIVPMKLDTPDRTHTKLEPRNWPRSERPQEYIRPTLPKEKWVIRD